MRCFFKGPVWRISGDLLAEMEYNIHNRLAPYTYLKIQYYHDTWVLIQYVLWFFLVLRFDIVNFFNTRPWENVESYTSRDFYFGKSLN